MFAEVFVCHNSKQLDRLFDYEIPKALEEQVQTGSRVQVPFGRGNQKKEGYVLFLKEKTAVKQTIKPIADVMAGRVFDEKMLELAIFIREKYLSDYRNVFRVIVPAGVELKPMEYAVLKKKEPQRSKIRTQILELIEENGGAMEVGELSQSFDGVIRPQLSAMYAAGILERRYQDVQKTKEKKVRIAELCVDPEEVDELCAMLEKKRAGAQARILEVLSDTPFMTAADAVAFGQGSHSALTALEKKGYIRILEAEVSRDPLRGKTVTKSEPPVLNEEQQAAAKKIRQAVLENREEIFLLHGVTGSGKTEVFMNAISAAIQKGRQAILLVPEISLTPQMVERFCARFGDQVAILHSRLSLGERYDEWRKIQSGEKRIVIGARSAVFAPCRDIGVIILDEEHENTYKSECEPRYDTHELAKKRAEQYGAALVFASATPSVESYFRAERGEYTLLELKKRVSERAMPAVVISDMRAELEQGNKSMFSRRLVAELAENLKRKEQTILFLNRRGFSTFVSCRSCGYVAKCPNCSISLTYHKSGSSLRCHYCGFTVPNPTVCPQCGSQYIRYFGGGTQRVEEEVQKLFPEASTLRMDVDTTARKFSHEKILKQFQEEKTDILIGTQMVTKGLDFGNVTLVGVISADVMLNMNQYRAGECAYAMLEQATGRAGRAEKPGRAVIQTYQPEHPVLKYVRKHDYHAFYQNELLLRQSLWYPPFSQMVLIRLMGVGESLVAQGARFFAAYLKKSGKFLQRVEIFGPAPAPIPKIQNQYRWQLLIKCESSDGLNGILAEAEEQFRKNMLYREIGIMIDKNPIGV